MKGNKQVQFDRMAQFTATYNCPKCAGRTFTTHPAPGVSTNKCTQCGLYYDIGGNKESLKKQILGEAYINPLGGVR